MKKITLLYIILTLVILVSSCSQSVKEKAQHDIKLYLKQNLKNHESYQPISFGEIDTLINNNTLEEYKAFLASDTLISETIKKELITERESRYFSIAHSYYITNSNNEKIKKNVSFYFDKNFIISKDFKPDNINGEYGSIAGVVFWKYNNYVGNKADIGSTIKLYPLDSATTNIIETNVDAQGNFKIDKVLAGEYFLIIQSENTTNCPETHLRNLLNYDSRIKQLFGFDIHNYQIQLDSIERLDSTYNSILLSNDYSKYGGISEFILKYSTIELEKREHAERLINSFPLEFRGKIGIYTGYSNALNFRLVKILENKTENINMDFGITCI